MIRYECDKCGVAMGANDPQRFIVRMELFAAAGHVELDPVVGVDPRAEMEQVLAALAKADPDEIEDQTYRAMRFDLCDDCRRDVLKHPLG